MTIENKRTSSFLMANLGAEVSRILSAKDHHDEIAVRECFERAQKILKEIMAIPDMKTRAVEMNNLSAVIQDLIKEKPIFNISRENITSYFTPFVIRAMTSR